MCQYRLYCKIAERLKTEQEEHFRLFGMEVKENMKAFGM